MDRVSVRSFRAADLAERGVKDLARSRLDTTREVVFQPLGPRFFEAREDLAQTTTLFREDGFHAPEGHFTRMTLVAVVGEPVVAEDVAVGPELLDDPVGRFDHGSRSPASSAAGRTLNRVGSAVTIAPARSSGP